MEKNIQLKTNEIYAVKIKDILNVEIANFVVDDEVCFDTEETYKLDRFQQYFYLSNDIFYNRMKLCNREEYITILKYIGDGKFIEFYTGKEINADNFSKDNEKKLNFEKEYGKDSIKDYIMFMQKYNKLIESPLYVNKLMTVDVDVREQIGRQDFERNEIANLINMEYEEVRLNIKEGLEKIKNQDMNYAYSENAIYDFKYKI